MDLKNFFFNTEDFQLTEKMLGSGTFGTVYVVTNVNERRNYAIKILKTNEGFTGEHQMYLMRESMILHKLKHPGIVRFIGVNFQSLKDSSKFEPSIITEYLPNGSLKKILDLEKKCIADDEWTSTKKYIALYGIANALKYLHENKIIHRDIKPENILIDNNYYPRVCDFGLSRCFSDSLTKSQKLSMTGNVGTPLYMAPELLKGEKYNSSVDVYAFAMLAYEIITGKEPYFELGNVTSYKLQNKVIKGYRPKLTQGISSKMKNLLMRCWSDKIEERPSFAEICDMLSSDTSYFEEDIDEDEFNEYIEYCNEMTESDNKQNSVKKEKDDDASEVSVVDENLFQSLDELLGDKKERNSISASNHLLLSSKKGNSISSYILGLLYENGEGVDKDFERAKYFFKESSKQGNSFGIFRIGMCYFNGFGIEPDKLKAFKYLTKSAKLGNLRGLNGVGVCYFYGQGVKQDYKKAIEYYQKAAELGNSISMYNLGIFYEKGEGVKQDYKKAFEYYQKAAELGDSYAMNSLGVCYEKGEGVKQDYTKAFEYYQKAAELGNPTAWHNLGICYEEGTGVRRDPVKKAECYQKAAELGYNSNS